MILKCNCNHEYQDEKYGKKNRVHNKLSESRSDNMKYKCTVCGKSKKE